MCSLKVLKFPYWYLLLQVGPGGQAIKGVVGRFLLRMSSLVYLAETVAENEVEVGLSDDLHRLLNHVVSVLVRDALN